MTTIAYHPEDIKELRKLVVAAERLDLDYVIERRTAEVTHKVFDLQKGFHDAPAYRTVYEFNLMLDEEKSE